jgi:hypothetical protein
MGLIVIPPKLVLLLPLSLELKIKIKNPHVNNLLNVQTSVRWVFALVSENHKIWFQLIRTILDSKFTFRIRKRTIIESHMFEKLKLELDFWFHLYA